ncbi:succinate dehydrogenase assembly factor 2 [Thiofilum flexile]|uniref:FAD assembly factor SdhE n=1 Tax=Thiofilum flexile TaxID=125627 RepID=UPI00037A63D4|nr:succinate dehydrogenase assembly factor 2 [Thiofilum flexile]
MSEFSRLKLRCRRGMKELDVILIRYLERHYETASEQERRYLNELLDLQDPILYGMVMGIDPAPAPYQPLIAKLAAY